MKKFLSFILALVVISAITVGLWFSEEFLASNKFKNLLERVFDSISGELLDYLDIDLITNEGKGLPNGSNGVYEVDFNKGNPITDVTDLGHYLDGCPTRGNAAVLVIPVEFTDVRASSKGYSIDLIKKAFVGESVQGEFYSLYDYYHISSYGALTLDITVLDEWFCPENDSKYYKNYAEESDGEQIIIDEALDYLDDKMDLSKFDSDGNGSIDSIVVIQTLDIDSDDTFNWAYRYWNLYTDENGDRYEYDGVVANDFVWASYAFMYEDENRRYDANFSEAKAINTYTYIHEFAHILGADDYYDLSGITSPLDGYDVMDSYSGDHNPFTKFNFGWIESSRLVTTDSTLTLTLSSFTKTGDTIIIGNNWDDALGVYQEYYIVSYYTNTGLNASPDGFFEEEGIVVYHVNAALARVEDMEDYYVIYNSNTFAFGGGSPDNLIEIVRDKNSEYIFGVGDSLPRLVDDNGDELCYTFTVDSIKDGKATLTFTKR